MLDCASAPSGRWCDAFGGLSKGGYSISASNADSARAVLGAMPLTVVSTTLTLSRPPALRARAGTTLMTSLRGLLLRCLVRDACRASGCTKADGQLHCRCPDTCNAPWLLAPRAEAQRRDHAVPVCFDADLVDATRIGLRAVLWGRRVSNDQLDLRTSLARAGVDGLCDDAGRVRWRVRSSRAWSGTVAQWLPQAVPEMLDVTLFNLIAGAQADIPHQLANLGHDLVQFVLADGGHDARLGKRGCDAEAEALRDEILDVAGAVDIQWREAALTDIGMRRSTRNGGRFPLAGGSGVLRLSGDLTGVAPWLALATLRGLGGRKSFGMGGVRCYQADGTPWPAPREIASRYRAVDSDRSGAADDIQSNREGRHERRA